VWQFFLNSSSPTQPKFVVKKEGENIKINQTIKVFITYVVYYMNVDII